MDERLKEYRKKYQGKYFSYMNDVSLQYTYIKKIIHLSYVLDNVMLSVIVDHAYIPIDGKPVFWQNDKCSLAENFFKKYKRISKSNFNNILKHYGS